jgi:sugar phosphate isomerase/epimerase
MRYGAMNFPVKPVLAELAEIAAIGFDYLELAMDPPCAHYSDIEKDRRAIRAFLNQNDMALICHLPTFVYTADLTESIRRASLDEMLHSLETAAGLNPLKVVLHPSYIGGLSVFVMETATRYALESMGAIIAKAETLGLCICLENLFPKCQTFFEPSAFAAVFKRFPALKLTLDIGHANIGSPHGQRIMQFIDQFGQRIGHVHVSDNAGRFDEHLPIGEGNIDFHKVAGALKKAGYDDTVTLEIFSEDRRRLVESRARFAAFFNSST